MLGVPGASSLVRSRGFRFLRAQCGCEPIHARRPGGGMISILEGARLQSARPAPTLVPLASLDPEVPSAPAAVILGPGLA